MGLADQNRRKHEALSAGFFAFAEALCREAFTGAPFPAGETPAAERLWRDFASRLREHAALEEEVVLPLAAGLALPPKGSPTLIRHDHGLIEETFRKIEELLVDLMTAHAHQRGALLVRRLSVLTHFADLFEHHTVRECAFLYPALELALTAEQRQRIELALKEQGGLD